MPDDLLSRLQPTNRVLKRAQYEALEFSLFEGDILVRNESHANPTDHEYRVPIEDGVPTACECPADERFPEISHRSKRSSAGRDLSSGRCCDRRNDYR